jgi:purine-binding chemotaxis protein CheW
MSAAEDLISSSELNDDNDDLLQFVTFRIGEEIFAVDMAPVQEIIRVPDVVRVPLAPSSLMGLANLRGKVLPIVSLRHLFMMEEATYDESTRAIVINTSQALGFVVDKVSSVIEVDCDEIEDASTVSSSIKNDILKGAIKRDKQIIMILDFDALTEQEFAALEHTTSDSILTDSIIDELQPTIDEENDDELQLVSFIADNQEYAIHIEDVKEIVQIPESITTVPQVDLHVLGMMNLRGELLPLIDLRTLFHLSNKQPDEKSRVIVISNNAQIIGLVVDSVSEVLRVTKDDVEDLIPAMAREAELSDITDICRLDSGRRLVSVLSVDRLFDIDSVQETLQEISEDNTVEDELNNVEENSNEELEDENQVVVFRLDEEEFAAPIISIQEIVRIPDELIRVPRSPNYLEGVINLRGTVLPVIDLRVRLGIPAAERSERQRIIVFLIHGARTGFIVDQVSEVLKLPHDCIERSPKIADADRRLFSGMAKVDGNKRMIQMLIPEALINQDELTTINDIEGGI